jgi:hypothetical protein
MGSESHSRVLIVISFIAISGVSATALALLWRIGGWVFWLVGPIFLWWALVSLITGILCLAGSTDTWPREGSARYLALILGFLMGSAIILSQAPPIVLLVPPIYSVVQRALGIRTFPIPTSGVYVSLPVWMGHLIGGEVTGCLAGFFVSRLLSL